MTKLLTPKIQNVIRFICNYRQFSSELNAELKPLGLAADGCLILFLLFGETDQKPSALAETLGMNLSTVTKLIDRLVGDNLIHRKRHPTDRRVVNLVLTDTGMKKAVAASKVMNRFLDSLPERSPETARAIRRK